MAYDVQTDYSVVPGQEYVDYAIFGLLGIFGIAILYEWHKNKMRGVGRRGFYKMVGHTAVPKKKSCNLCDELKKLK